MVVGKRYVHHRPDYDLFICSYRAFLGGGFILGAVIISVLGNALRSEIAITWGLFGISGSITIFAASVFLPLESFTRAAIGAVGVEQVLRSLHPVEIH